MANTKSSASADPVERILAGVSAQIAARLIPASRVRVGLSGGVDSVALLDALTSLRDTYALELTALYVNHGISPHAAQWGEFCQALCARHDVPCTIATPHVAAGPRLSLEA